MCDTPARQAFAAGDIIEKACITPAKQKVPVGAIGEIKEVVGVCSGEPRYIVNWFRPPVNVNLGAEYDTNDIRLVVSHESRYLYKNISKGDQIQVVREHPDSSVQVGRTGVVTGTGRSIDNKLYEVTVQWDGDDFPLQGSYSHNRIKLLECWKLISTQQNIAPENPESATAGEPPMKPKKQIPHYADPELRLDELVPNWYRRVKLTKVDGSIEEYVLCTYKDTDGANKEDAISSAFLTDRNVSDVELLQRKTSSSSRKVVVATSTKYKMSNKATIYAVSAQTGSGSMTTLYLSQLRELRDILQELDLEDQP